MRHLRTLLRILTPVLLAIPLLPASGVASSYAFQRTAYEGEVLVEGGLVVPFGDLADSHDTTLGFGADKGYEVGFRFRQIFPSGWAVSPSFLYVKPEALTAPGAGAGTRLSATSMYRYGLDAQYFFRARGNAPRFFLTGGAAVVRNRLREDYDDGSYFSDGYTSFAVAGGGGVRSGFLELTVQYQLNRFTTTKFWAGDNRYDWDTLSVRMAVALPNSF